MQQYEITRTYAATWILQTGNFVSKVRKQELNLKHTLTHKYGCHAVKSGALPASQRKILLKNFKGCILTTEAVDSSEPLMYIYGTTGRQSTEHIYWNKYSHDNLKTHVNMLQNTQCAFSAYNLVQD
jgi:hypothetical protein